MSAIQRDREIAARANEYGGTTWESLGVEGYGKTVIVTSDKPYGHDFQGEIGAHIVRLHNRQPLYDALVDSGKRLRLVWMAMAGKMPPPEIDLAVALSDFTAHLNALDAEAG